MDEKYLQDLYEWIKENDSSYEGRYNYNQFKQKMQDNTYASKMHEWIGSIDDSFAERRPLNNFLQLVKAPSTPTQQQPVQKQQPVQQAPAKKKEPTVSSSEGGWSDWLGSAIEDVKKTYEAAKAPKKEPLLNEEESEKAWKKKVKREPENFDFGMSKYVIPDNIKPGHGVLLPEKKYSLTFLGRRTQEQIEDEVPEFIKPIINKIDANFLKQGKDNVKKDLTYYLDDAGFETKILSSYETGSAVDMIAITAPDGEVREFQIFSNLNQEADKIKQFIKEKSNLVSNQEYWYKNQYKKFKSKEEIDNEVKSISNQENLMNEEYKKYLWMEKDIKYIQSELKRYKDFGEENTPKYIQTSAYLKQLQDEYQALGEKVKNKAGTLIEQQKQLEKAAGKYLELQSEKGTFSGALYRGFMDSAANIYSQYVRLAFSGMASIMPSSTIYSQEQFDQALRKRLFDEGIIKRMDEPVYKIGDPAKYETIKREVDAELRDKFKKAGITGYYDSEKLDNVTTVNSIRENLSEFLNMPTATTKEYKEKLEKEGGFVTRGLLGLSGSIPAMLGGPAIRTVNMFMMNTDAAMREMDNDPSFAGISENEKALVALPIGVVGAALEEIGFRNLVKGKSVTSSILKTVLGRVPSNASASLVRKTALDVIAEMGIRGTTAYAGGILSEMETGALQQANEYLVKDIYNTMKGNKMFDNPEFLSGQYLYDIWDASRTEGVGAGALGVPYSISAAFQKDGFQALDDTTFKIFEELTKDGDSRKFFVTSLKNKINQGEITAKQSQQMLDAYDQASGMIGRVPDEITDTKARKIAMDLISERKKLEGKREKYDDALAKPIQDKIDNINKQLTQLTEDAIQKQTTGEVSVQPEAGAGQEVEVGGPEAKPKITPEESKRKEDLVAALEATDKDVIAIGDELLDRKEAQAELEAITQKEQAPVTEQGGMEQAPAKMTTTEILTATPTETKTSVTFVAPDGNEVALEGNEQVAAQLYDEAVAVAEEQRTPEQNDIIQKMQPIVAAAPAVEQTPTEVTPAEVTPTEQFTEQDRARKAELEEAMRKADKRRKNITVGETTMPKAEAKAELDALVQKEQAVQQPVTPAVEVAPTEVAPTETRTAEQEADLLEELLTGKKKEPMVTETVTPTVTPTAEVAPAKEEAPVQPTEKKPLNFAVGGTSRGYRVWQSNQKVEEGSVESKDPRELLINSETTEITPEGSKTKIIGRIAEVREGGKVAYYAIAQDVKFDGDQTFKRLKDFVGRGGPISVMLSFNESDNVSMDDVRAALVEKLTEVVDKSVDKATFSVNKPADLGTFEFAVTTQQAPTVTPTAETKAEPTSKEAKGKKSKFIDEKGRVNVEEILKTLSDKFSIPFEIINDPDQNYSGKFEDGRVYVNLAYVTAETPWHEFAHPFIEQVKADNPKLYSSLVNEINTSTYGKQVLAEVKELYPELSEEGQIEEAIVETIARLVTGKVSKTELKENKTFFQKVLDFVQSIKDALAKMLGVYSVNIADLNNNFTLKHIAEIMQYGGRINLKEYSPIINKNKSKEVRYYINGNRLVGEQKSIADEFSNLVDYIKKPNNDRLLQFSSFLKLKYLLEKDLSFLPKEIIEKYKKIIDDVLVIFPNKNKERTKENLKAEKIFYKSKLDEIILLYPKLQIEKKSKDLPSIQFKNQWTVKDFKSAYHNIGAYMNNAGISSINDAINNFINLLSTGSRIEVAAYSSESALETIGGTIRLKFKQETPVIRSYLTDVQSSLIDKNGKLERITEKGNLKLRTDIDEEIETYMFSSYDELFINATKNNIKDIEVLKDISPEELGKLKELSELTGAPIIQNNQTIYEPSTKREYKPESVKYSKFTPSSIADAIVKNLTIKAGGLQSNILGIPIAIWNSGVKTMAAAVRAGAAINEAVQKAIEHIRENHGKKFNEAAAEKKLLIGHYKGAIEVAREAKVTNEGLKAYFKRQGLTDAQIEALLTFKEKAEKKPISKEKVIGKPKPKKVTVNEMTALKDQLRLEAKAAREAKGDLNTKRKMLAAAIKDMVKKGKITVRQAAVLINKVNSVNLDNPVMVERMLDYAEKVFNNAEFVEKMSRAKKLLKTAKENVRTKIGVSEGLTTLMNKLFSINPNIIPDSVLETYLELVEMMGKRQAVLTLKEASELTKDVENILDVITDELSNLDELIDIFDNYENKVLDKDGKIDFSATLDKMLEDGTITPNDVKLYKKYKNKVLPKEAKEKKTEQQLAEDKKELIDAIRQTKVDESNLGMREERDAARNLISAMTPENLNGLTNAELANLLKVLDNINNGFFPHYAVKMTQKLNATNRSKTLDNAIKTAGRLPLTKLIANIKSLFPGAKSANMIMTKEAYKYALDQVFGFFKKRPIFDSVFKPVVEAFSTYKTEAKEVKEKLEKAFNKVAKSYWNNPAKVKTSEFKMMAYALQLEYNSNKDKGEGFYSAAEYIKETIKHALGDQSTMSDKDRQILQKILDVYGVKDADGKVIDINIDKLYDSFNNAEKQAIKTIQEVNSSIRDKAMFTAAAINGNNIMPIDNYVHHNVLPTGTNIANLKDPIGELNKKMNPSTRAAVLKERTPGAKPLNFNIFGATQKAANEVLMDFHLTEAVRTSRATLNAVRKELQEQGNDKQMSIFNAIDKSFETVLENTLTNTFNDSTFVDNVVSFITKQAYRTLLAGVSRWTSELISNLSYVMTVDPVAYANGTTKYRKYVMSEKGPAILKNIKSGVQDRVYEDSILSGRMIDSSIMSEAIGLNGTTSNYMVVNAMQTIYNNTLKKGQNFVAVTADTLISTPDKGTLRPFWFGIFAKEFKKETGQEVNFDKIAANDEAYLSKFKEAIDKSKEQADYHIMLAGSSKNPFASREKAMTVKNASALAQIYKSFNNFMIGFITNEYVAARTGIYAMMGNGRISRRQGSAVLAGVVMRTTLYSLLIKELGSAMAWLFLGDDDEEEEEEKSLTEKAGKAFAGSMTSLILGRDFGNLTRNMINYGVEKVNENYVQKMIDGKYTKDDVIAFSGLFPSSTGTRPQFSDLLINMTGAGQPFLRSAKTLYETYFADEPKREETIKKRQNYWRYTLPLEVAGHLGFVPLYKDVKSITNKALQKEVDKIKAKKDEGIIKRKKFEDYDSAEEFEMEDPEGYAKYEEIQKRHREERRADKKELLNGYDSVKLFQESDEEGYLQAIKDGSIYEYQERERKRFEEKHEDEPFRGLSEERFKKLYPTEWRKFYGPGTAYFKSQRTPEALKRKAAEKRQEAEIEREEKKAEIKRKVEEAKRKRGY